MSDNNRPGDWIVWAGGACPVAPDSLIDVRLRDGFEMLGEVAWDFVGEEPQTSQNTNWLHDGGGLDIVADRAALTQQEKTDVE